LLEQGGAVSVQVLNEFIAVARRKLAMPWSEVVDALAAIRDLCGDPLPITTEVHDLAVGIARDHDLHIYDATILASATLAGARTLYTEDLSHGWRLGELRISNPFRVAEPK
jgi:predicted nucleic acid-binding protein